jgi:hypothetical protein
VRLTFAFLTLPLLLHLHAGLLSAQSASPENERAPSVVKIQARSVVVDVIVTRGNDEPASGLNAQDFAVFEDGKEQHLNFFEEHSGIVHQSAVAAQGKAANIYSNIPSNPESDSVTVLLLDRLTRPLRNRATSWAR